MDILDAYPNYVIPEPNSGCWLCTYAIGNKGYARLPMNGRLATAHRVSYELSFGPILPGLEIDHLCRNKACVNPSHLEAVTPSENIRRAVLSREKERGGRCSKGHLLDEANLLVLPTGARRCRECATIRTRRYRLKNNSDANNGRNTKSAFNVGYAAFFCGLGLETNPYKNRFMVRAWDDGWNTARLADRRNPQLLPEQHEGCLK
jgi:hypothetical protein